MTSSPYVIRRNDGGWMLEQWAFSGLSLAGTNSDRGRLYVKGTATGGTLTVSVYKEKALASGDEVARGTTASTNTNTSITLSAQNSSGLTGSVVLRLYSSDDTTMIIYPLLAIDTDLNDREDNLSRWRLSGQADLEEFHLRTLRTFHRRLFKAHPPHVAPANLAGAISHPFRENDKGEWEVARLRNVESYRDWAIEQTLADLYITNGRTTTEGVFAIGLEMQKRADALWQEIVPEFDLDADDSADQIVTGIAWKRG